MKKLISLVTVVLLLVSFACPVFAAQEFVPSISYKGAPEIVTIKDASGKDAIGVIRDASGAIVRYVYEDCLWMTPVARAAEDPKIPDEAEKELLMVYDALKAGTMKLPYGDNVKPEYMVIRDLFDLSWICETHGCEEEVEPVGVVLELTFDLGVDAKDTVVVMTYKNGAWGEITKVVNNGDGTITCTFEHLCPVSVSVMSKAAGEPDGTGDAFGNGIHMWIALMAVCAVAVVAVTATRRKVR